jgi:hypothetical protein
MKTYIYGYNNCITFEIKALTENDALSILEQNVAEIEYDYDCQLPDLNCFDLIACF